MLRLSRRKLLHTKWTAMQPQAGEKHFTVVHVAGKKSHPDGQVTVQAVLTGHTYVLNGRDLTDERYWRQGWH